MINCYFNYLTALKNDNSSIILLCHGENYQEESLFKHLNDSTHGRLKDFIKHSTDFVGKEGQTLYFTSLSDKIAHIHLIGCNHITKKTSKKIDADNLGRSIYNALTKIKTLSEAFLYVPSTLKNDIYDITQSIVLNGYYFGNYHTKNPKTITLKDLHILFNEETCSENLAETLSSNWKKEGKPLCEAVFLTRDFVSEPANILTPETYMQRIKSLEERGLEIEILDQDEMQKKGFGALLGVAKGSDLPPYTVIMRYYGTDKKEAPLAFIGKGVTFDSGGISIKPAAGMDEMKADMGGSAAVIGLMRILADRRAHINAIGVVGLVENMVSGRAQRPGDIVTSHSGQTIEVLNTDAEGRLVLADLLSYTKQTYQPKIMINLATLTGAIIVAIGTEYAGLFSNDDDLAQQLLEAGQEVNEALWRMPLGDAYNRQLNSDIADMKNIGGRPGSSILAAEFLKRFIGETSWAHLDIAGTAWKNKASSIAPKGATGYGVRLLNAFVKKYEKSSPS